MKPWHVALAVVGGCLAWRLLAPRPDPEASADGIAGGDPLQALSDAAGTALAAAGIDDAAGLTDDALGDAGDTDNDASSDNTDYDPTAGDLGGGF